MHFYLLSLTTLVLSGTLSSSLELPGHKSLHTGPKDKYAKENAALSNVVNDRDVEDTEFEPVIEARGNKHRHNYFHTPHFPRDESKPNVYGEDYAEEEDEPADLVTRSVHGGHRYFRMPHFPRAETEASVDHEDYEEHEDEPSNLEARSSHGGHRYFHMPHFGARSVTEQNAETDDSYDDLSARDGDYHYSPYLHDRLEAEKHTRRSVDPDGEAMDYAHPYHDRDFSRRSVDDDEYEDEDDEDDTPILPRSIEDNWHGARAILARDADSDEFLDSESSDDEFPDYEFPDHELPNYEFPDRESPVPKVEEKHPSPPLPSIQATSRHQRIPDLPILPPRRRAQV